MKEVAILNGLDHRNVVKFMKVSDQPPAIMLEYVSFDLNIFGQDVRVSALSNDKKLSIMQLRRSQMAWPTFTAKG